MSAKGKTQLSEEEIKERDLVSVIILYFYFY